MWWRNSLVVVTVLMTLGNETCVTELQKFKR